ncbi:phosphoribosylaminoimidazole synthetase [Bacillus coahuilensis m2-6]|uniref:Phosphoribosylformylglycinamidine cyclo-ligase n=1 Tax=Bacillus coahuilensis p1.1.43 TaxID=1150625 RepID=A0A147KCD9_9BACI|nr:phosphoribosylformylglycinamidine cyclo-ligase [Bacillus coahuilensis]KUP09227.1 phosphoribosylaminoimidazole synthetase [Bacillus coahuilensis p1.1.43]KUP09952.1 phosphoribosylaminoimidazole synthetase [Bacillus coahuilensis m2-6]
MNQYKDAGVNIEAGYEAVERMKSHVKRTERFGVMGTIGGFGGLFDLSSLKMKEPVLVSGTDGVGTKLKLAFQLDRHDTIGIDCVAMCVNDIVVQGATPLFFLDYIACGKAFPEKLEGIVKGIADGCVESGAALIGGETAEMPGLYDEQEYDLAGFVVGACEKPQLITGENICEGDRLIGISSSGVHSNGFSLVRKIIDQNSLDLQEEYSELGGKTLGEALLTPTKIYVKPVLEVLSHFDVNGMAHITGGGFYENIPRMLPNGLGASIHLDSFKRPAVFALLQEWGSVPTDEMYSVFNMGVGFIMCVPEWQAAEVVELLESLGETASVIGKVVAGEGVTLHN